MTSRRITEALSVLAVVLIVIALFVSHGWADYLLIVAAVALLGGSYWLRHHARSDVYDRVKAHTPLNPDA